MGFIFGGDTPWTYDDIQKKRQIAQALTAQIGSPSSFGQGLSAIGKALAARGIDKRAAKREGELDAEWQQKVAGMGLDPKRAAIFEALKPGQREGAVLSYLDQQDAARRQAANRPAKPDYSPVIAALTDPQTPNVITDEERQGILSATGNMDLYKMAGDYAPKPVDAANTEYGLQPQYYTDGEGNLKAGVFGKNGTFKEVEIPGEIMKTVQKLDLGTHYQFVNSVTGEKLGDPIPKDLAGAEKEKAIGKGQGEAAVSATNLNSKLPGIQQTVDELWKLADDATYTLSGQALDTLRKEAGMEPRPEAIARAKYIAIVDNQILPLLRDTFGAQFTVKEGETLRATLGDPNKTPAEKKAVLDAFIRQKISDVQSYKRAAGETPLNDAMDAAGLSPEARAFLEGN